MFFKIKQFLLEGHTEYEASVEFQKNKKDIKSVLETFNLSEMKNWDDAKKKRIKLGVLRK